MLEKVAAIIREQLNQENVEITEATRFKEDLEVDSLDLFELVMAFEEEYGVSHSFRGIGKYGNSR